MRFNFVTLFFLILTILNYSFAGTQKRETKIDSMSYETGAEWRIYSTTAPVKGFVLLSSGIWAITDSSLCYINTAATKKSSEPLSYTEFSGIPASDATSIALDKTGNLWIGTKSGVVLKTKDSFKVFTTENGLCNNSVNKIIAVDGGKIYVATEAGVSLYESGKWTTFNSSNGLAGDNVRDCVIGKNGTIWFATNKGISCFDGTKWTTHNMKNGLSWNDAKALGYDKKTETIWAAVGDKDMNSYDGKSWKIYMEVADGISCIMIDTQSRVWIGTSSGIMKFNGEEWISDPNKIGISASTVSQMIKDEKGNLWFGTEKGVIKLDNPYPF